MGALEDEAAMGAQTQQALKRFRTADLEDLPEGDVATLGISPNRPVAAAAGKGNLRIDPDRLNTAVMSEAQLAKAAEERVELPGSARVTVDDLAPKEVSRIIKAPSSATSFATKASALYKKAWDMIPTRLRVDSSRNPDLLPTRFAGDVINGILRTESGAKIQGGVTAGKFGRLAPALKNLSTNFTFENLRYARTEIGRAVAEFGTYETSLSKGQLNALYGAVTRDMEAGLVAIAARARQASKLDPANPAHVSPAIADKADKALRAFRRADRYTRLSHERMNHFMSVLGADNMNAAARKVLSSMRESTQNVSMMRELFRSLRPEERNAIRGHIFENMGRGRPGSKEAEAIFNFNHWATDWAKYMGTAAEPSAARKFLLDGLEPEIARRLDNISRIVNRMKYYESTKNFSGTAYTGGAGIALMSPSIMTTAAALFGSAAITGKLLTSRAYTSFLENFMRQQMRLGNTAKANAQITGQYARRLSALAGKQVDPELGRAMQAMSLAIMQEQKERQR
jgi:hypothetical protein